MSEIPELTSSSYNILPCFVPGPNSRSPNVFQFCHNLQRYLRSFLYLFLLIPSQAPNPPSDKRFRSSESLTAAGVFFTLRVPFCRLTDPPLPAPQQERTCLRLTEFVSVWLQLLLILPLTFFLFLSSISFEHSFLKHPPG